MKRLKRFAVRAGLTLLALPFVWLAFGWLYVLMHSIVASFTWDSLGAMYLLVAGMCLVGFSVFAAVGVPFFRPSSYSPPRWWLPVALCLVLIVAALFWLPMVLLMGRLEKRLPRPASA